MSTNGKIEIANSLKAYIEADDLILVDRSKLSVSQESRLYFEVCLAISMCFLGATLSNYQLWLLIMALLFGSLSTFFAIRFKTLSKTKKLIEVDGNFKYGKIGAPNL